MKKISLILILLCSLILRINAQTAIQAGEWTYDLKFSSDGKYIFYMQTDGIIKTWSIDGELIKTFKAEIPITQIAISPDGKHFAYGNHGIIKIRNSDNKLIKEYKANPVQRHGPKTEFEGALSLNNDYIAYAKSTNIILRKIEGQLVKVIRHHYTGRFHPIFQFSADNKYLITHNKPVSGDPNIIIINPNIIIKPRIKLWNLNGEYIKSINYTNKFYSITISPDSKYLLICPLA